MAPDISALPDDPAILRATAQQLVSALREAQRRIQQLEHEIAILKRSAYGKKSEKVVLDQLLLSFAQLTEEQRRIAEALAAAQEAEEKAAKPPPRRHPHGRGKLPEHLPVENLVETLTEAEVVDSFQDPVYARRTKTVTNLDGTTGQTEVTEITGYRTRRVVRREPRTVTQYGRLGVTARLVFIPSGEVLWSGSDVSSVYSFEESARAMADSILKAVKKTWPSQLKK